jgi:hypothetical protein
MERPNCPGRENKDTKRKKKKKKKKKKGERNLCIYVGHRFMRCFTSYTKAKTVTREPLGDEGTKRERALLKMKRGPVINLC